MLYFYLWKTFVIPINKQVSTVIRVCFYFDRCLEDGKQQIDVYTSLGKRYILRNKVKAGVGHESVRTIEINDCLASKRECSGNVFLCTVYKWLVANVWNAKRIGVVLSTVKALHSQCTYVNLPYYLQPSRCSLLVTGRPPATTFPTLYRLAWSELLKTTLFLVDYTVTDALVNVKLSDILWCDFAQETFNVNTVT